MGYCVSVNCKNFSFGVNKADDILNVVKDGFESGKIDGRWIYKENVLAAETIEDLFEELRFELYKNEDKYKIDYFTGEKLDRCEEVLFQCIAPYIDDGYLEYIGEDGEQWRYIFKNGECKEVYPKVIYDIASYDTDIWDLEASLGKVGIQLKTTEGEFRKLSDILNDVADAYTKIVDEEFKKALNI